MLLNRDEIMELLEQGKLVIEPLVDVDFVGPVGVDLRLGTQIGVFSNEPVEETSVRSENENSYQNLPKVTIHSFDIGQNFTVHGRSMLLASTLEYIKLPQNVAGYLVHKSSVGRFGLQMTGGVVDPGFHGKLTFSVFNGTNTPVAISPGIRIMSLVLSRISPQESTLYRDKYSSSEGVIQLIRPDQYSEVGHIQGNKAEDEPSSRRDKSTKSELRSLLDHVLKCGDREKGKALENLMLAILKTINGLRILKTNVRLKSEEIDIIVANEIDRGFWRVIGSPILVECKNWSNRVSSKEVGSIFEKLTAMSPQAITAILVAPNGVTGDFSSNGILKIREKRQIGRNVIVIDETDLEMICNGVSAEEIIGKKYDAIFLI